MKRSIKVIVCQTTGRTQWADVSNRCFLDNNSPRRNLDEQSLYSVLLCLGVTLMLLPAQAFAQCGGERWSVKIGSDGDVGLINLNNPTPTTLASLTSLAAPNPIPDNKRVQPTETTLWVINATLKQYQKQADSDYHLLLIDGSGHQMIAEIPSPNCASVAANWPANLAAGPLWWQA